MPGDTTFALATPLPSSCFGVSIFLGEIFWFNIFPISQGVISCGGTVGL
jgi:hypothetical protein